MWAFVLYSTVFVLGDNCMRLKGVNIKISFNFILKIYWPWWEGEIDQRDLSWDLRSIMGIGQLGGDVELEVIVVRNDGVTQFNHQTALLSERL